MSAGKDVDEAILEQARALLPYIRANGVPGASAGSLSGVPWLFVLVFELLTTESIPQDMKRFNTLEEQAQTLQMILNTLELTLQLPLNHITGRGLARLESRHLSDALQIFTDLVKHYFPERDTAQSDNQQETVSNTEDGRGLSLSHLESPCFEDVSFSKSYTPELSVLPVDRCWDFQARQSERNVNTQKQKKARESPIMAVRPVPQTCLSPISTTAKTGPFNRCTDITGRRQPQPQKKNFASVPPAETEVSIGSSASSITLLKQVFRQSSDINAALRKRTELACEKVKQTTNLGSPNARSVFERRLPSLSLFSPTISILKQKTKRFQSRCQRDEYDKIISPIETRSRRFKPYEQPPKACDLIEYPLTKRVCDHPSQRHLSSARSRTDVVKTNQNALRRAPSAKFVACRKPSVKSFRSPNPSAPTHTASSSKTNRNINTRQQNTMSANQHHVVKTRDVSSRNTSETKARSVSSKESQPLSYRLRKPSVVKAKSNTPVSGRVRKPPQPLARKCLTKSTIATSEQRLPSRSGNCDQRIRQDEFRVNRKSNPGETEARESKFEETVGSRRRPSVISTKVRKHSTTSSKSPVHTSTERNSRHRRPVNRGEVSPQTTSLCSSLKLLEEFDFVSRRLKEITVQKLEYMEAINKLEREEVRLEYLLTHVQQQSTRALKKGPSGRLASLGAAV